MKAWPGNLLGLWAFANPWRRGSVRESLARLDGRTALQYGLIALPAEVAPPEPLSQVLTTAAASLRTMTFDSGDRVEVSS